MQRSPTHHQKEPCSPVITSTEEPHFVEKSVKEHSSSCHNTFTYNKDEIKSSGIANNANNNYYKTVKKVHF